MALFRQIDSGDQSPLGILEPREAATL